jgi:regulatory protein
VARRSRRSTGSRADPDPEDPARKAALRFLSYRIRSREEVAGKLREEGFTETIIARTLERIARLGYLDDRRFTQVWIRSRMMLKGYGRELIRHELLQKGVPKRVIEEVLTEGENDEEEAARRSLAKRFANRAPVGEPGRDPAVREKAYRYLYRRGFPSEVIRSVLKEWPGPEDRLR